MHNSFNVINSNFTTPAFHATQPHHRHPKPQAPQPFAIKYTPSKLVSTCLFVINSTYDQKSATHIRLTASQTQSTIPKVTTGYAFSLVSIFCTSKKELAPNRKMTYI